MNYTEKLNHVFNALGREKPGIKAHNKMSPYKRQEVQNVDWEKVKKAATLLLLFPEEEKVYFVLIERADYKGVHGGQIAFPGGKVEDGETMKETALREAEEEIGVDKTRIQVLGELTEVYVPASDFIIFPFVGFVDFTPTFAPNEREVKEILKVSLDELLDEKKVKEKKIEIKTYDRNKLFITAPYFDLQDKVVWGATAAILNEFKEMIKSEINE